MNLKMAKLWCATVHFFVLGKEPSNFNLIIFAYQIVLLSSSKGPNTDLSEPPYNTQYCCLDESKSVMAYNNICMHKSAVKSNWVFVASVRFSF